MTDFGKAVESLAILLRSNFVRKRNHKAAGLQFLGVSEEARRDERGD